MYISTSLYAAKPKEHLSSSYSSLNTLDLSPPQWTLLSSLHFLSSTVLTVLFVFLTYTEHSILVIFFRSFIPFWPIGIFKFSSCNLIFIYISFLNNLTQFQDFEYCICNTNAKFIYHVPKSKLMYIIVHSAYPSILLIGISIAQGYSVATSAGMHKDIPYFKNLFEGYRIRHERCKARNQHHTHSWPNQPSPSLGSSTPEPTNNLDTAAWMEANAVSCL